MKNLKNTFALFIVLLTLNPVQAQTSEKKTIKNMNGHLVDPTSNCVLRYYYYPNLEAYYDTQKNIYYFTENGKWIEGNEIPNGYRGYSLYNKVNVIIKDYDDEDPTQFLNSHKKQYPYITKETLKKMTASVE